MDLLGELEAIASSAAQTPTIDPSDIQRWQALFGLSAEKAQRELEEYRDDLSNRLVSEEHWGLVKDTKTLKGFDIEAYSYSLKVGRATHKPKSKNMVVDNATYIFKLEAPLDSSETIQRIAGLTVLPGRTVGKDESGCKSVFCTINAATKAKLLEWLSAYHPTMNPTIVRLAKSRKELSSYSLAPHIGLETSLPHQRAGTASFEPLPQQHQYPVWYFFYGRLLDPDLLQRQLNLPSPPIYRPARISRAKMRSWRNKYKAVTDGDEHDIAEGGAFLVEDAEQEDSLRFFETDMYEVVRCRIEMVDEDEIVPGLVFRFCGPPSELGKD